MAKNYYDILRVAEDANEEAIRKGYRKAMREKHSDLHSGDDASADRRVRELNAARDTLTNPELRRKYDQQLQKMKEAAKAASASQASDSTPPTRTEPGKDSSDQVAAWPWPFIVAVVFQIHISCSKQPMCPILSDLTDGFNYSKAYLITHYITVISEKTLSLC